MSINWLKKASKTAESNTSEARRVVDEMLATIKKQGEEAVRRYASVNSITGPAISS